MKTLYLDCGMGAAGDMLAAALLELVTDKNSFLDELNNLCIPGVRVICENTEKCGIAGTHFRVIADGVEESEDMFTDPGHVCEKHDENHGHEAVSCGHAHDASAHGHDHEVAENHHGYEAVAQHNYEAEEHHHGHGIKEIAYIVEKLKLSEKIKKDILNVYDILASAESQVHGKPVDEIHFHEFGTMDALTDITAVCMLMDKICVDEVIASPVHVGSGSVRCAHGILPVPAPATALILQGVPVYSEKISGELCTPTGAALLKYFVNSFGEMPVMIVNSIGYGMGKKDFPKANCVRAMLGETKDSTDVVAELICNIDDMTGEAIGFAQEILFNAGALEVFTTPVQMKKSRPGIMLSVMCRLEDKEKMLALIFKHTTTIGVRENISRRYTLSRSIETIHTEFGDVRKKVSEGYGVMKEKLEYDDLSHIAKENDMSLQAVISLCQK